MISLPNAKDLQIWVIGTLCTVIVTLFGLWLKAMNETGEAWAEASRIQRECDDWKLRAKDAEASAIKQEYERLQRLYDEIRADQEKKLKALKRLKQ
jgi:hypothetical protein